MTATTRCLIPECGRRAKARGWCSTHYTRWVVRGDAEYVLPSIPVEERFWSKVDKSGPCWLWTGSKSRKGYGSFKLKRRTVQSHRWSWEQSYGEIPAGLVIDHTCHNPACVKPGHLRLATTKQNGENRAGSRSSTGYRGVTTESSGRFSAHVRHHGRRMHVGTFDTAEEAARAAAARRGELFTHNIEHEAQS